MEERKRPASYETDETAPPQKRQATNTSNGGSKGHQDADMPGRDELEKFQKEAIIRQMHEYKREKMTLETRLNDLTMRATYHDDHLRAIDAWFEQLLDEVKISLGQIPDHSSYLPFPSTLLSTDNTSFESHLKSRASAISSALNDIVANSQASGSDLPAFQEQLARLQLEQKSHANELERTRLEKAQMEERLETASMRYMVAEKKLDRAKSLTVAKLERQAVVGGRSDTGSGLGGAADGSSVKNETTNGQVDNEAFVEADQARKEALATSVKQAEQIEQLAADNDKLNTQIMSLQSRLSRLTDEDYAQSDLFKQLKHQHEDVINKMNGLEATNAELRKDVQKFKEERSSYRMQLDSEVQAAISEKDLVLAKAENDLARIRTTRDELAADLQIRKASQDQEKSAVSQTRQLLAIREERIAALESEIERIRASQEQAIKADIEALADEEIRVKHANLQKQYSMLNQELASMSAAYKKLTGTVSQKFHNASEMEEKVARLSAEKAKADQKYFAAMKYKEAKEQEIRTLRAQNSKSSDIVSQLKEAEASTAAAVVVLEKQIAEARASLANLEAKHHAVQGQVKEKAISIEGLDKQAQELKSNLVAKENVCSAALSGQRKAEIEVERLKVEVEEKGRRLELWKTKGLGSETEHYEALRGLAICNVCRRNFKDTVIKTCGHVLCHDCVDERLQFRMRKCPNCNKTFGANDYMRITM